MNLKSQGSSSITSAYFIIRKRGFVTTSTMMLVFKPDIVLIPRPSLLLIGDLSCYQNSFSGGLALSSNDRSTNRK